MPYPCTITFLDIYLNENESKTSKFFFFPLNTKQRLAALSCTGKSNSYKSELFSPASFSSLYDASILPSGELL